MRRPDQGLARRPAGPGSAAVNALLRELLAAHRIRRHPVIASTLQPLRLPAEGVPL
jgi:hypothetical protein